MTREEALSHCPSDSYVERYGNEWLIVPFAPVAFASPAARLSSRRTPRSYGLASLPLQPRLQKTPARR
jgi:hypothetical protein